MRAMVCDPDDRAKGASLKPQLLGNGVRLRLVLVRSVWSRFGVACCLRCGQSGHVFHGEDMGDVCGSVSTEKLKKKKRTWFGRGGAVDAY